MQHDFINIYLREMTTVKLIIIISHSYIFVCDEAPEIYCLNTFPVFSTVLLLFC